MKKLLIFLVVLLVFCSIIFGTYKWYSSSAVGNQTTGKTVDTSTKKNIKNTSVISKNKDLTPANSLGSKPKTTTVNKEKQEAELAPLNYKYASWGDIQALRGSSEVKAGILVDTNSRNVLWAKHSRMPVQIASMTKMMTVLLTMEDIKAGKVNLNTVIKVTREASKVGGSQVYLDPREQFTLKQLLKTVLIKSANDSAFLIGQYLGHGDINSFILRMNKRAKQLNMPRARYFNDTGLPKARNSEDNKATPEGLVFLAEQLLKYPIVTHYSSTPLAYFRTNTKDPMMLVNTNDLVRQKVNGVIGLKTGYTYRAGFCLTFVCDRANRRLIGVVTGFKTARSRDRFVKELLDWGFHKDAILSLNKTNTNASS